jgi:hypothetical protein
MIKTQEKTPEIRESVRKELGRSFLLGCGVGGRKVESEIFERKVTLKLFALNTKTGKADLFIIYLFIYLFWCFDFLGFWFFGDHEEIIRVYLLLKHTP